MKPHHLLPPISEYLFSRKFHSLLYLQVCWKNLDQSPARKILNKSSHYGLKKFEIRSFKTPTKSFSQIKSYLKLLYTKTMFFEGALLTCYKAEETGVI